MFSNLGKIVQAYQFLSKYKYYAYPGGVAYLIYVDWSHSREYQRQKALEKNA